MKTIDLEQELLKQNAAILSTEMILAAQEYDKLTKEPGSKAILKRIGFDEALEEFKQNANQVNKRDELQKKYDRERIFDWQQIQSLCVKYRLRFLSTKLYKGTIDSKVTLKVSQFELAHQIKTEKDNYMIVAPKESFRLQSKPKDPLLFYDLGDGFYYLIHKWGNDLSFSRRINSIILNTIENLFLPGLIAFVLFCGYSFIHSMININADTSVGKLLCLGVVFFITLVVAIAEGPNFIYNRMIYKYDSEFE